MFNFTRAYELKVSILVYTYLVSANPEPCVTPNHENAQCVPLASCPVLLEAVKSLNSTAIDFAKKSVCKTEENDRYVCCGTYSYLKINSCVTPNQEIGECVKLESCPAIFDGVKVLNEAVIDFAQKSVCKLSENENNVGFVCCGTSSFLIPNVTLGEKVSTDNVPVSTTKKPPSTPLISDRRYCGYQHTDDRFSSGSGTAIDEFPWVAFLIHENDTVKGQQRCLGVLLNNRYVLTTAICVNNTDAEEGFKITTVRLGEYNTDATTDCVSYSDYEECSEPVLEVAVQETILHPNFRLDITGLQFNIALIRLANKISYSDYVRPICLPDTNVIAQIGSRLTTSGWGTTVWEPSVVNKTKIKKSGNGVVVPMKQCIENSELHNLEEFVSEEYFICFREGATGSCIDDSSAPLMLNNRFQWQLEGIVAFPIAQKCGEGSFNLYANVTTHLEWISNTVRP